MQDSSYSKDRKQGDQTIEAVKKALGLALVNVGEKEEDLHQNTDLYINVPSGGKIRIAMRMRKYSVLKDHPEYKYEFTIRCHKQSGDDTEWQKMMGRGSCDDEYGDYNVYGFQSEDGKGIEFLVILDLNIFRDWWKRNYDKKKGADGVIFKSYDYDSSCGELWLHDEIIGYCKRVQKTYENGEDGFDYFYVFDWRKIPGIVVAIKGDVTS